MHARLRALVIMISHTGIPIHGREVRGLITHDEEIETIPLDIHGGSTVVSNMFIELNIAFAVPDRHLRAKSHSFIHEDLKTT